MKRNETVENQENIVNMYRLPAVESFFNEEALVQTWPESITNNEDFISQIEARKKLQQILSQVCNKLSRPDITLESAIAEKLLSEEDVSRLYGSLSKLLESGLDYDRIILYLPFEFLPDSSWQPETPELEQELEHFKRAYLEAWRNLLSAHDVRANFVDGDVPEVDLRGGELVRVVKAAHLLPMLVIKGLIQTSEVFDLIKNTENPLLRQSIGEALLVMSDMGIIPESEIPKDLPVVKHAEEPQVITARRKKWLEEKEIQESNPPLEKQDINAQRLLGPFSKNLDLIDNDIQKIREAISFIKNDEELSTLIFPVVMISGSRLKGYGTPESDIDIGIFVKPGILPEDRSFLQEKIREIFSAINNLCAPVEFWLKEEGELLKIDNLDAGDPLLGEDFQTQFLFGSVWEGDVDVIKYLREKLLTKYFYENDEKIHGQEARKLYLGELERDALQYRLMHKGYQKFFPPYGGINTLHSDRIDSKSMFWDSGFRQLATQLFINRIFLPKLPVVENKK